MLEVWESPQQPVGLFLADSGRTCSTGHLVWWSESLRPVVTLVGSTIRREIDGFLLLNQQ